LCVNSQEGLVAVGNDSGRVHIVSLTASSPSPVIQTLTKDTRKLDKVTSLVWSDDSKTLYSGHANGVLMAYHLGVGKKPRSGRMGACFFPMSSTSSQVNNSAFVLAARPNGRVWEANTAGVVYRYESSRSSLWNATNSHKNLISIQDTPAARKRGHTASSYYFFT
ncbi:hypothetical protein OESDEN_17864, partial [Oesophagostomum dentatum]